jgi:hypothetical protein
MIDLSFLPDGERERVERFFQRYAHLPTASLYEFLQPLLNRYCDAQKETSHA